MAGANNNPVDEAVEVKRSHDEEEIKNAQGDVAEIKSSVDEAEKAESSLDEAKSSGDEESSADEEDSDRFGVRYKDHRYLVLLSVCFGVRVALDRAFGIF